ncbi:MAG: FAD-binding oxidoreductase, partial [Hyphomicrobiales bacterium]|nr:FAD-binding oxidoreductase [Hyphomicrobiales bacterium]
MTLRHDFDVLVLGAGIVGVSTAIHLQRRGLRVALVDRRDPGEETSYGNAGIIVQETVEAHGLPETLAELFAYALNLKPEVRYDWRFLPKLVPYLAAMRRLDAVGHDAYPRAMVPMGLAALGEHEALMQAAGAANYLRKGGWLRIFRSAKGFDATAPMREAAARYGIESQVLSPQALAEIEPHIAPIFHRAVLWPGTATVTDPGAVTKAYARRFSEEGGAVLRGDAQSLRADGVGWRVMTAEGELLAPRVVVALGPWSPDVLTPLGLRFPFAVERGYHRHFAPRGNAVLGRPVLDADVGYVLAPMTAGIRLTTGVEFADRDAPKTPV